MRAFNYSAIREQKWDSEILGLIAAIYKEAGKQENKQDGKEQPQVSNPQEKQEGKTPGAEEKKAETAEFLDEDMEFDEELENEIHRLLKDDEES